MEDDSTHASPSEASTVKISTSTNVRRQEVHVHAPFLKAIETRLLEDVGWFDVIQ